MRYNHFALSELAQIKYGKNQSKVENPDGEYPIYGTGGLMSYADEYLCSQPSVLIGRKGTIDKVRYVDTPFWTVDTLFYTVIDTEKVIPKYLYYKLSQLDLNSYNEGTTIPSLRTETLNRIELDIQDRETQEKVVKIVSPIETKIETNNRINDNLEKQGALLIGNYFNRCNDETELSNLLCFINGFAFSSKDYLDSGRYKIITIKNVQDGRIDSSGSSYLNEKPVRMKSECELKIGDVLLSLTGNVGRVGMVCENNLLLNQRVAKIKPKNKKILPLIYFIFRQSDMKNTLESISKGTAQQNLSPIETLKLKVKYDAVEAVELARTLKPMLDKIVKNNIENTHLATLRDTLLPELLNGKIDLSKVEI